VEYKSYYGEKTMFGTILCLAAVTLGVEFGWEPNDNGGLEYIIQISPESLEGFQGGKPLWSDFPRDLRGLQTIRFQVGEGELPRKELPAKKPIGLELPSINDKKKATSTSSEDAVVVPKPKTVDSAAKIKPAEAEPAIFTSPVESEEPFKSNKLPGKEDANSANAEKPWTLFWAVVSLAVGLAAALVYLVWVHIGMRNRYRSLLAEHLAITHPT
jgi:hypothetical protein